MGNVDFHAFNLRIEIGRLQEKNASLQAENERLKKELTENRVTWALWIKQHEALQSKIDRVSEYCGPFAGASAICRQVLDILK